MQRFYNERRRQLTLNGIEPNAAHLALARLEREWIGDFLLITQNVDNLHERAGSKKMLHLHGELNRALCRACGDRIAWLGDLAHDSTCTQCKTRGQLRPDVVWFGEVPYHLEEIGRALDSADLFLAIGTSGLVYPAAGFAREAKGARKIEVNLNATDVSGLFDEHRVGPAGREVARLVDDLLSEVKA